MSDYLGRIITKNPTYPSPTAASGVWTLDEALQYQKAGKWPPGYAISRSVRLRSSASAYFNRTLSTPTSNTTWTLSCWLKRGALSNGGIFAESTGYAGIYFASDKIRVMDNAGSVALETTAVYRDPSAWAHLVVRSNGTNIKAYWNSVEVGSYTGTITLLNAATSHFIGRYSSNYFDGYLTEINFIDGQALTPASFGYADTATGVWQPLPYTGTYGTNGFYLNFSDNSAATAAAIGKDYSGNGNNWTPNNISVTAGATYDSMVDSPSSYGTDTGVGAEVRGNYCVMNPVAKNSRVTIANANLQLTGDNTANHQITYGTFPLTTGKWYWEVVVNNATTSTVNIVGIQSYIGFADGTYCGSSGNGIGWGYTTTIGNFYSSNFTVSGTAPVLANGTIGIAYDADAGKIWFRNTSGSWVQGDPAAGTSPTGTLSGTATAVMPAVSFYNSNGAWSFNFGQQAFSYAAPSGYKALNTQNLPVPTINNGANYMAATLYTGNGAAGQSVVNTVNGVSFAPDFAWVKVRSTAGTDHYLADTVRGATKYLQSNTTAAEGTNNGITAFNSNGFSVGAVGDTNTNGATIVGWNWKAGGTAVSNTSGSITSSVSANPTAGFSVVTYTATAATGTIGHGLGVAPSMIITARRSSSGAYWGVYHQSLGASQILYMQVTNAATADSTTWNATSPTSSVFSVGNSAQSNNPASATYVAYCFAPIAGYSAFGTYTGNGSSDGPFVYCGFRPRYLWIKRTNSTGNWIDLDTSRSTYNSADAYLSLNASSAEATGAYNTDILSNGFKLRYADPYGDVNASGSTYVYAAFAENPFKYARAR